MKQHPTYTLFEELVQDTVKLIRFDSSMKVPEGENGEYPFGKENADCLQFFLSLAESFGFETHNYDNYVGEVIYGSGKEFAVLAHLDVVPAGSGWNYPPFGGVINDDISQGGVKGKKIWGRGAMDDKGPAMACLYALRALKENNVTLGRKIKLIVGCNEEAGWKCIEHYNKVATMPKEGFTPDANFPVIYAEKGILHITMNFAIQNPPFTALSAGECANMVCDFASAIIPKSVAKHLVDYTNPVEGTTLSYDNSTNIIKAYGKSAHGSTPQKGANALQALLAFLRGFNEDIARAYYILFDDGLQLKTLQDETGFLTMSPDMANFANGKLSITTDIRFPATLSKEEITDRLQSGGVEYEVKNYQAPLYNDKQSELISTLLSVYSEATGKTAEPIAIGGGTYARALKCGCAFGPEGEGEEATIHQPNEYITLEKLKTLCRIYYDAIKKIGEQSFTCIGKVTQTTKNK